MKRFGTTEEYTKVEPEQVDEDLIPRTRTIEKEEAEDKNEVPAEKKPY